MKRASLLSVWFTLLCASNLLGVELYYLPQVADGSYPGGSIRTTFILFNPTATAATATIFLTDDQGQAFDVTISGFGTDNHFGPISLAAGQIRVLQTDGTAVLGAGGALIEATGPIAVSSIFSLYDTTARLVTEAGVGSSAAVSDFIIPVDTTGPFNTGIALFNPSEQTVTANMSLVGPDGSQVASTSASLAHDGHLARFVGGPDGLFPAVTGFVGSLRLHTTRPVAGLTLRQHAAPLSNTTLPVIAANTMATQFHLPQVANGQAPGSSVRMRTTFVALNVSAGPATITFTLRNQDGTPMAVTIPGGIADNSAIFTRVLPPGGSAFFQTDGSGVLQVGTADVASSAPIGVSAIFTLYSGQDFVTEAGVGDSAEGTAFTLPVDIWPGADTGVAFENPHDTPTELTVGLLNADGQQAATPQQLALAGRRQTAKFVSELFPVSTPFRGSLVIIATQPIAAITLRQNNSPLSYTTLPVADGAYLGN